MQRRQAMASRSPGITRIAAIEKRPYSDRPHLLILAQRADAAAPKLLFCDDGKLSLMVTPKNKIPFKMPAETFAQQCNGAQGRGARED